MYVWKEGVVSVLDSIRTKESFSGFKDFCLKALKACNVFSFSIPPPWLSKDLVKIFTVARMPDILQALL